MSIVAKVQNRKIIVLQISRITIHKSTFQKNGYYVAHSQLYEIGNQKPLYFYYLHYIF